MSYSYTPSAMREFDRRMDADGRCPLPQLMEIAGQRVFQAVENLEGVDPLAYVLVGKGNNGGDAMVAARLLAETQQWSVRLVLACEPAEFAPLPKAIYDGLPEKLRRNACHELKELLALRHVRPILIDGLLGTGCNGQPPREPLASLIRDANASHCPIYAIDVPSGLNAETGEATLCIQATETITLAAVKTGMLRGKGIAACGRIVIGELPGEEVLSTLPHGPEVFTDEDARALKPRFPYDVHKFAKGAVTVFGGSSRYSGAPMLAGTAALSAGAGLSQVVIPQACEVFCSVPQALIVHRLPDAGKGCFNAASLAALPAELIHANAVAVGPGMSANPAIPIFLQALLALELPMVLDADALNLLPACSDAIRHPERLVLTPHPGEFARLQQGFGLEATGDRADDALALSRKLGCVVVLKGARTLVVAPDGSCSCNLSGSPALATAGSGDVLTGTIAAFLANGLTPWDAARLGVFLHGRAGEPELGAGVLLADQLPSRIAQYLGVI